jgi:hypothetical protein
MHRGPAVADVSPVCDAPMRWLEWGHKIPSGWRLVRPQYMRKHVRFGRLIYKEKR